MTNQMPQTLCRGDNGAAVEGLQTDLSERGYDCVIDGVFGENTEKAVKAFQKDNNLTVDGIVGFQTGQKFGAPPV